MKVTEDPRKITVSQVNLAKALGVTTVRVNQLIQEGIVIRDDEDKRGGVSKLRYDDIAGLSAPDFIAVTNKAANFLTSAGR